MDRKWLPIGQIAKRSGVNASALRFYEEKGLIQSLRSDGGQRLYPQDALRRIAFIRVAQGMGLSLGEIAEALAGLPDGRTPDRQDWERIAGQWQALLDRRIETLQLMKRKLGACIGCGCLSLEHCGLYNPEDQAAAKGSGPRYLLGDQPPERDC
ncbi:redox-sensitive transcriptional activator SoxR [Aeromonas lusitana]|uniref:Redox-sensitive transcriptional activator SoxR n=1 Tax=Aeromonas lusitana TaxID=931529 RepID=A0A2M8H5T5_9GAMM|nr:redox-sensitive transcriptional activator SoxR [Aeromonas lusitana]PJC91927.1 redox-sensitive transcriptional activator SoxR [Aeromonas lusitana]